ncbi:glycosyl transferase [Clostridium sp. C1]|uniref:ATP-grasp fold amidoligase family protein n=1 Tax=Clostridium sp. C1 TaxID=1155388 RepID=UPI001BAA9808|nr:ATP-grasp fold amidoligase family protein [Clostridium sp. C1]QUN12906.1 glycosyl transferase [Clostridium sp. C1]
MYYINKIILKLISILHIEKYISDKKYLEIQYYVCTRSKLNLKSPNSYNEKIQWLKLYDHNPIYPMIVDKNEVREYVKTKIGDKYLTQKYGVFDNPSDIKIEKLPQSFVIKCTHDSGNVYICEDKNNIDYTKLNNVFNGLKNNFYYKSREWPYKNVKPRLIIEENLSRNGEAPIDYKFMCFNGKVKYIQLHEGRFSNHKSYLYDRYGNTTDFNNIGNERDNLTAPKLDMELINKMIELAETLAEDFIHIRVDFYYVDNKIYFGELTLYDAAGLVPWCNNGDIILGKLLDITSNKALYKREDETNVSK